MAAAESPSFYDWPAYWFVALERAVESGNHQEAAHAQRELARLGVTVRYAVRPRPPAKGGKLCRD